jgi:branched-chain amino acid transport system substrate-binding protein
MHLLAAAAKKANSTDGAKLAEVLKGLTIPSPFGADGNVTLRAEDQTLVGYAIGWGTTIPTEPYVTDMTAGDWKQIFELEADWKKKKNYA